MGIVFVIIKEMFSNVAQLGTIIVLDIVFLMIHYFVNKTSFQWKYIITCISCFLVGFGFWKLEDWKIFCFPDSIIQFHAIWHITTAVSLITLYFFLRTEEKSK
jgi:hypothetical protein